MGDNVVLKKCCTLFIQKNAFFFKVECWFFNYCNDKRDLNEIESIAILIQVKIWLDFILLDLIYWNNN